MAAAAILNLLPVTIFVICPLWVVAGDVCVKFHNCSSIYGWVIKICQKIQDGGCRHLELIFCYAGPPTKSLSWSEDCVKISCQSPCNFRDMTVWKFCKFGLKRLFRPQKLTFLGAFDPKHYFSPSRPPKGTSLRETASYELSRVEIGSAVFAVGDDKNKQESLANAEVSARQPCWFKVIQGRRFWYQWKAHLRLSISH